ncbi:MAG: ABC transporter substrate-binding protein [Lachnospiraceae bacterium]|nr:ABC transporter substrate-binding protein [Lachnospiraceae bacterium]
MKKKFVVVVFMVLLMSSCLMCGCNKADENSITVFNYGMYMDPEVLKIFEEETGIKVKYEEAPTPEELYTKYKSGAVKYDVLCTSEYMLQRLINEGELQEVDFSTLKNRDNIGDEYFDMCKSFDPDNKYVMPYFWGTVGILYDKEKVHGDVDTWDVLFNGEYAGEFIMQNSMRDAYMVALKQLGYSINTTNEAELREAQELLIDQKPDVQSYLVDEVKDELVAGNATLGVVYSGEGYYAGEEREGLVYCIPREGTNLWIDCFGVTKDCKNVDNAMKFLDYLCREDCAKINFDYVKYASPYLSVIETMTDKEKASSAINPSKEIINNCEIYVQLPQETTDLLNALWKELKAE